MYELSTEDGTLERQDYLTGGNKEKYFQ